MIYYGFAKVSLNIIKDYLSNRIQRTKVDEAFSKWLEIAYGVLQGSILGPLLFNIYICDIILFSQGFIWPFMLMIALHMDLAETLRM